MSNDKKNGDELLDHEYDGIRELDNQLPRWWLWTFYLTIIFSAGYYYYYEIGPGPTSQEELDLELAQIEERKNSIAPTEEQPDETKLIAFHKDQTRVTSGKGVYQMRCASCHGGAGQGGIGPNLTDKYWLNGDGKPVSILKIVKDGVAAKGMPPWGAMLTPDELYTVSAYVLSLKGTNPPGAKAPQGEPRE